MLLRKFVISSLLLMASVAANAAISATAYWNVRTDGTTTNGGCFDPGVGVPGTDYTAQAAAQITYTDLVIGATTTQLTSAGNPFTSATVGNCIHVTGGTGFTTGWYEILSVSGSTATMDRSVGTAASSGGTGLLGGALTLSVAESSAATSNTIYIKSGTYTLTSTISVNSAVYRIGYNTVYTDRSAKPLITTATNSVPLYNLNHGGGVTDYFINLQFTNTATTRAIGFYNNQHGNGLVFDSCYFSGFGGATDNGAAIDGFNASNFDWASIYITNSEFTGNVTAIGTSSNTSLLTVNGTYFHGNGTDISYPGVSTGSVVQLIHNIFAGSTTSGVAVSVNWSTITIVGNTFYGITNGTSTALSIGANAGTLTVQNNVFYGNNKAIAGGTPTNSVIFNNQAYSNAFGNNTNANTNWSPTLHSITLTANPFVNAASGNFAPNTTAGGGAALTGAGYPAAYGTTTTNNLAIGAVQPVGSGGSSAANSAYAQ